MTALIPPELPEIIENANSVAVLTGAGISAESGVPTFRGPQGLWKEYRPEELATPEAFARNPELVWSWYQYRRELIAQCQPNAGHLALAQWESLRPSFSLITQNVDGLHRTAGSHNILELHGNIRINRCCRCGVESTMEEATFNGAIPHCSCGGMLRPGVVWFGEALPEHTLADAITAAQSCRLFLTVGTSSLVYPAAALPEVARSAGAVVVEVNPETTPFTASAHFHLQGPAGTVLPQLLRIIEPESLS